MKCQRPGCTGEIVDGYCDLCGMAPVRESTEVVGPPAAEPPKPLDPSTPTVRSHASTGPTATTRTRTTARNRLGAGLVEIPPVPYRDPATAVLSHPEVPERKRFCGRCGEPVGRSRKEGEPGRTRGFCANCRAPFDFEPKLSRGEIVGGQYAVEGCLAHGGMGWVYLARDRNVSDRWVVLKGVLNAGDSDAVAAALAEREFLAQVEHPNIVKIYNFAEYDGAGYIVMEYVGGQSLKQMLVARHEANGKQPDPLPVAQAIAYMIEILPAMRHLHEQQLLFCDFKLDNVMQTQDSLKLIDLGGVYRIGDTQAAVFGTAGYQAPEISSMGPSVASDLFTVARTLAVLCTDFRDYQKEHRFTLPSQESVPLYARYDSLYRFLCKGTAADRADRFQSAEEMADQLYGVLCEIVADQEGRAIPVPSTRFTGALRASIERPDWRILPHPQVDTDDASAGYLAAISATDPEQMIVQLRAAPQQTAEVNLLLAAALIDTGDCDQAESLLVNLHTADPRDWRTSWYRGVANLARGDAGQARANFTTVYEAVPGELAPKLALAIACEIEGNFSPAAGWYEIVSRTDPSTTSASFGLARCRLASGDREAAIAAYGRVPDSSSGYVDAQIASFNCLIDANGGGPVIDDLLTAGSILEQLPVKGEQRARLTADLLEPALELAIGGKAANGSTQLLGHVVAERDLRVALERCYRTLARSAENRAERIRLVDDANRTRPRTWT